MPFSPTAAQHRYERLLVQQTAELHLVLDQLGVHASQPAIPAVPLHALPLPEPPDLFQAFNYPPKASLPVVQEEEGELESPQLSKEILQSFLAIAEINLDDEPKREQKPTSTKATPSQEVHEPPVVKQSSPSKPAVRQTSPSKSPPLQRQPPNPQPSGPFRTARSRLPAKRALRPAHVRPTRSLHAPGSADGDGGTSAAMAATRAVLCTSKRARTGGLEAREEGKELPEVPNVDEKFVEMIMNEMLDDSGDVQWDDIAGLQFAKRCVMEAVVWPMKRPDIFTGLRGPPKGLLLFGPPGTGKTMIGRAIASQSGARFFNISASSLMSKWVGEGEKMVRALFGVARALQPSVVFIDEIDSLLTQRTDGEQESSRRVKTEFLVQMDGAGTSREDRVLVVGATNRPQELDEAARRRLVKRLYIPLPDPEARASLVGKLLEKQRNALTEEDVRAVSDLTKGYSGSDLYELCSEAALGPVRELGDAIGSVEVENVRPVKKSDFEMAVRMVRASVSEGDMKGYLHWNEQFGSFPSTDPTAAKHSSDVSPT